MIQCKSMVQVSMVPMYPMVLFGGTGVEVIMQRGEFVLSLENGWIKFVCESHVIAELLKVFIYNNYISICKSSCF